MGNFSSAVGLVTFIVILVGQGGEQGRKQGGWVRRFGWDKSAKITPTVMGALALPFFAIVYATSGGDDTSSGRFVGITPLHAAVFFGTLQALLSKSSKYAFFDPTLQMVYLPLTPSEKTSGKAAIDVLGSRLGKSSGSLIQQLLVVLAGGSIVRAVPGILIVYYAACANWFGSVVKLGELFRDRSEEHRIEQEEEKRKVE